MINARRQQWMTILLASTCVALMLAMTLTPEAKAQVLYGSIVGDVKDQSGLAVPGASVTLVNKGTNLTRQVLTDEAGRFAATDLPTGTYSVKVSQQGFKTFEQTEVTVSINAVTRLDVSLQVGSIDQVVTVSAEPPKLQTETSEVAVGMVANELENLPVPLGRNYQQVYRMLPGFSPPQNSHSIPTNPARSLEFTVNGTSDNQNNTRIDGVSTTHVQLPHIASYVPTLESIQEVNVVTSSMDAEQGLAGGAAISVQTRSGTNDLHGSAFEYHTDNHLKAWPMRFDDAALNTGNKPKQVYNEFGGTVGGPIKKNKVFYFVSYEGTFDRRNVQGFATVPLPAMLKGDLSASTTPVYDPLSGDPNSGLGRTQFTVSPGDPNYSLCNTSTNPQCLNIIPASRMDSIAKGIAAYYPAPNLNRESRNYFTSAPFVFDRHQVDTKIDYNLSSKMNLIGTFGILHYNSINPSYFGDAGGDPIGGGNAGHGHGNTYRLTVMGTYTFTSNFLMDAHFGWARQGTASEQPGLGPNVGSDKFKIPGTNGPRAFESGWPEFQTENYNTIGVWTNFMPYYRHDPQYQYVVNANWMKGKHNLRFGGDVYRQGLNHAQAEFASGGYGAQGGFHFSRGLTETCEVIDPASGNCQQTSSSSRYNSIASFLLGVSDSAGRTLQVPDEYKIRAMLYSLYARDRWTVTPKLTLSYGIRWEYFPVPTRPDRGIEYYDPETNKSLMCGYSSVPSDCGIEVSKRRFSPRVGLAYRVTDKFVIRAGYGLTNDPYEAMEPLRANYPILIQVRRESPNSLTPITTLSKGIPAIKVPDYGNGILDIPSDYVFQGLPKNLNRGYIQSWNLTLQRELPGGFTAQAGYVATRSIRTLGLVDINAGQIIGAGEEGKPLFAKFGRTAGTIMLQPVGTARYDSLQAQLQRRFTAGLALSVNYTFAKSMTPLENSDNTPETQALSYMNRNYARAGSPSVSGGGDRTHVLGITNIWQLPFGKGKRYLTDKGALSYILGGWQVNNLVSIMSGPPFTVYADDTSLNLPGTSQYADQVKPEVTKLGGLGATTPYYDPSAFADVTAARFGNSGRSTLRGPGLFNWDFGLFREFAFTERVKMQFRMESFNFTNTPHLDVPDGSITDGTDFMTVNSTFSLGREGIDERQFRFGLRLVF
ncbi:MAG TPA: TonB-dependent receptor [Acidobacteriota bacterium]|nr:TonB-dependent receptor [Acidobacteriota bacterium]